MINDIKIGPVTFHMYGLMIALGLLAAVSISWFRAKKKGMNPDVIYDMLWASIIGGALGTRILYYVTVLPDILKKPSILWDFSSGYVVYGGILGGILANIIYFKWKKMEFLPYFDLVIPQVALGQAIGRIGCFFAGCCYGKETNSAIGFTYHTSAFAPIGVSIYPTQLISCAGDLLIFLLLLLYAKKKEAKGTVGALYFMLYSAGRFFIEFLRGDENRGKIGIFSTSQLIAIVVFFVGLVLYIIFMTKGKNNFAEQIAKQDEEDQGETENKE